MSENPYEAQRAENPKFATEVEQLASDPSELLAKAGLQEVYKEATRRRDSAEMMAILVKIGYTELAAEVLAIVAIQSPTRSPLAKFVRIGSAVILAVILIALLCLGLWFLATLIS